MLACLAALALVGALALRALPSADDAQARVATTLESHHGAAVSQPVPDKIGQAVVAIEDRRFYINHGVDPVSMARVALGVVTRGSIGAGGATISQQLAKLLYVPDDSTLRAKLEVAGLAIKLDYRYSKDDVLAMYLNATYFGSGHWGIVSASRGYFGKSPAVLTWGEASLLAGLLQAPSAYDPLRHLALAKQRQNEVLQALVRAGVLGSAEAAAAYAEPLDFR